MNEVNTSKLTTTQDSDNEASTNKLTTTQDSDNVIASNHSELAGRSTEQARKERNKQMKRVPLRDQSALTFKQDPNLYYREVIDRGGNLERFKLAGYQLVEKDASLEKKRSKDASIMGKYMNRIVGTGKNGEPLRGYIMCIKREWYEADQKAKQVELDKRMMAANHKIKDVPTKQAYGKVVINDTLE